MNAQLATDMAAMRQISALPAELLIPHYLIHSYLYYRLDVNLLEDSEYDQLARRIFNEWDNLTHRHKFLIHKDALLSGGSYITFPSVVAGTAKMFAEALQPKSYLTTTEKNMALNARAKGQRGEREVIDLLQPHVNEVSTYNQVDPPLLQRNTLQSDQGGFDIVGLSMFAIEVKRVESDTPGQLASWWAQAVKQATPQAEPILIYRMNARPWLVRMFVRIKLPTGQFYKVPGVVSMDAFIFYMKSALCHHQQEQKKTA